MKLFFFSILLLASNAFAQFSVPPLSGPVVDSARVLSYEDEKQAGAVIRKLYESGQGQLVLVTLPSLGGQTIEQVGIQIADKWKLGTSKADNGILLIAAVKDRAVRIEVGQGLEGTIPDATANRIIEDIIIPTIRSSGLSNGLLTGVIAIAQQIDPSIFNQNQNEFQRSNPPSAVGVGKSIGFIILIIFILFIKLIGFLFGGRGRRSYHRGGWRGGGGFGGGGFGGGGFGGGGGGFSGGGASGRW